jgi:hypothetical protein
MPHRFAAPAVALALLVIAAPASARPTGDGASPLTSTRATEGISLPSPEQATSIASVLWAQREQALNATDASRIDTFDAASAKAHDLVYLANIRSGETPQLVPHPLVKVIPQIPRGSDRPVFFAQILTTNGSIGKFVWYVVAIERGRDDTWRIGFMSFGDRDKDVPPLSSLTRSDSYTPRVTAELRARITRQAMTVVHAYPVQRPRKGVVIRGRGAVDVAAERIYGLVLPSGEVLSCFTWHTIETIRYTPGVLEQRSPTFVWGRRLAVGDYRSITIDEAVAQCTRGTGKGTSKPTLVMQDLPRRASTTGVRASR